MQPSESPDPLVTISKAEYNDLRQKATATQTAAGQPGPALETTTTKTTIKEKVWFGLGLAVLVSFAIPGARILFLPIFLFGILAIKSFVDDTHHTKPKGVLLVFKIIAWLAISAFVGIALLFILFIAALSSGGGIG